MIPLLAVAHGSSDPEAAGIAAKIVAASGLDASLAFLEHEGPRPAEVLEALAARGADRVVVVPLLLSHAGHATSDIGTLRHPGLRLVHGRALGPHPLMAGIMRDRIVASGAPPGASLLVVSAGTRDATANASVVELAGSLQASGQSADVAVGFASLAGPTVAEAAAALRLRAAAPWVLAPYFLSWGRLLRAAVTTADPVWVAEPLGGDARLGTVLAQRYREAIAADATARGHT